MKPPATFETARLRLRTPIMDDAEAIFTTYANDAEATRYVSFRTHRSSGEARDYLRRCAAGWAGGGPFTWVIALREEGRLAGAIDIRPEGHRVELGYILGRAYWGRGYMTEVVRAVADWDGRVSLAAIACDAGAATFVSLGRKPGSFSGQGLGRN